MEVTLDGIGRLTTEHAASSYGQPVLVIGGEADVAHGPGDYIDVGAAPVPAWRVVERYVNWTRPEGEARELAETFIALGQAAGGVS